MVEPEERTKKKENGSSNVIVSSLMPSVIK